MELIDLLGKKRSEFTIGIQEFDVHVDFGRNQIISICTDESMLSTQLLHFLATKSAIQGRHTWYFDIGGNFDNKLYGIPDHLLERISVLRESDVHNLSRIVGALPDNALVLVDTLNMIYHEKNPDKYVSQAMAILNGLRNYNGTIIFTEFTNGITNEPPTAKFQEVYYRIFLSSPDELQPHYRFNFDITKCGRGVKEPVMLSKFDFEIPRDSDYHKYFAHTYG